MSSSIPRSSAERAKSAIEASTMRTARETTQVRRQARGRGAPAGAAAEPGQPVPLAGMVALDAVGLLLADEQPALRDQLGVGLPAVGAVEADTPALQAFQHSFEGGGVTTPQLPV